MSQLHRILEFLKLDRDHMRDSIWTQTILTPALLQSTRWHADPPLDRLNRRLSFRPYGVEMYHGKLYVVEMNVMWVEEEIFDLRTLHDNPSIIDGPPTPRGKLKPRFHSECLHIVQHANEAIDLLTCKLVKSRMRDPSIEVEKEDIAQFFGLPISTPRAVLTDIAIIFRQPPLA